MVGNEEEINSYTIVCASIEKKANQKGVKSGLFVGCKKQ
jgi:hypothetical protein